MKEFRSFLFSKIRSYPPYDALLSAFAYEKYPIHVDGLKGSLIPLILSELFSIGKASFLIILPYEKEAAQAAADLRDAGVPAFYFPDSGHLPYSEGRRSSPADGERFALLQRLASAQKCIVTVSLRSFLQPVTPPSVLSAMKMTVKVGGSLDTQALERFLSDGGYTRTVRVSAAGEFAVRGEVVDVFPPGQKAAVRIVAEWDVIEKIRRFDPLSQESIEEISEADLYPAVEWIWSDERIDGLASFLSKKSYLRGKCDLFLSDLREKRSCAAEEQLYPLSFGKRAFLSDYLKDKDAAVFVNPERFGALAEGAFKELKGLYARARTAGMVVPTPEEFLQTYEEAAARCGKTISVDFIPQTANRDRISFDAGDSHSYFGNIAYLKEELQTRAAAGYRVFIFAGNAAQGERLRYLLRDTGVEVSDGRLSEGFVIPPLKILCIAEHEIFGRKRRKVSVVRNIQTKVIDSFLDLNEGDYVVHVNHGVAVYRGIERVVSGERERDYIKLEYAQNEILFIPTEQVNLVQRYLGGEGKTPSLDVLGGKSWQHKKEHARKSVEDLADMLLDIYSEREQARGYRFSPDTEWQSDFEARFPYEETEDQLRSVAEIKADMESDKPMDRLLCGDTGYGKTEVAMRAAFKAAVDGKQTALIAPTTILAGQHYENFVKRFEGFPVRIELLSRFVKGTKQKEVLKAVAAGEVDILIGTHRLLQKDVVFKDLGLLIVDEEHRFGVKDKERLKTLKANVDALAMSATPIPRTLHMSLLKIRDISLITTSPYNRKPIETVVCAFDERLIRDAVMKEVERGGQVFYLHNRIESLESVRLFLEKILPEVMIETAHGRMSAEELDEKMHRFINNNFQVLLSTTIIESGIDIPNVNTIIIDRADMYGISQLYQLKGRVGRSDRSSYAWLFYPKEQPLSEAAVKRLQVISDFGELGSGFRIAMKDMEIRGAGNLLGREQHGEIASVGYEMYLKLLDDVIGEKQNRPKQEEVCLDLEYSGYIPNEYIADKSEKMAVYKRIASIRSEEDYDLAQAEIDDRYGPLPPAVASLFAVARIKLLAEKLGIVSIRERGGFADIVFGKISLLDPGKTVRLISENPDSVIYRPERPDTLRIKTGTLELVQKSAYLGERLQNLL